MTIDARRRKNQKKKLKQKEKKAAANKIAASESIPHKDEKSVDDSLVSDAQEEYPIIDRVAAEEVLPANLFKEKNPNMTPQNEIDTRRSPQLVPEPMGQAMELTPDLDYEGPEGEESRQNSDDSYDDNEEAIEIYDDYMPARRISSQSHHRSRSLSAITAPHLSEDTSENDVLLEGSIERRMSLQNKRKSEEDARQPDGEKDVHPIAPIELSERSKVDFNLPSDENAQNFGIQPSFPFPSRRLSLEQEISPNAIPRDLKRSNIGGVIPPIENENSINNETDEDVKQKSVSPTELCLARQVSGKNVEMERNEESDKFDVEEPTSLKRLESTTGVQQSSQENHERESTAGIQQIPQENHERESTTGVQQIPQGNHEREFTTGVQQSSQENHERESTAGVQQIPQGNHERESTAGIQQIPQENHERESTAGVQRSSQENHERESTTGVQQIPQENHERESTTGVQQSSQENHERESTAGIQQIPQGNHEREFTTGVQQSSQENHERESTDDVQQSSQENHERESTAGIQQIPQENHERESTTSEHCLVNRKLCEGDQEEDRSLNTAQHQNDSNQSSDLFSPSTQIPMNVKNHHSTASGVTPLESENQLNELFRSRDGSEQRDPMPWEAAEPNHQDAARKNEPEKDNEENPEEREPTQESSKYTAQIDTLFDESGGTQERMPWEASEQSDVTQTARDIAKETGDEPKPVEPRKFSFLEDDDDLLEDDDSYLESDEESEDANGQTVRTVASELTKNGQKIEVQPGIHTTGDPTSPISSHDGSSKYKPSNLPQVSLQNVQRHGFQTAMPLETVRENSRANMVPSQNEVPVGFVARQRQAIEGQNVIEKINEEKKKSDAFDFPMDLVSKRTEKVPAKPVGVPSSRVGSPPPFEICGPPRSSRHNSVASLPNNPYATAAHASRSRIQSPLPPQGVVPPQNALGSQLPSSQLGPVPGSRKSSVRSQYAHGLRARGFSNASSNGSITAGASVPFPPQFSVSPPQASVIPPTNKYMPSSPLRPVVHPALSRPVGEKSSAVPSVNVGTAAVSPYGPSNSGKPLPCPPPAFSKGNVPHQQIQTKPPSNVSSMLTPILPAHPYGSNIETTGPKATPEANLPRGSSAGGGPPIGGRGKKTGKRTHARSNSSIYAPNQNEHTSKYAPTVHPQYQHSFPPEAPTGIPNALSAINAYMKSSHAHEASELQNIPIPRPVDNEALLRHQFPLFSWSSSDRFLYGNTSENGQNSFLIGSCSSIQDFSLVNVDALLNTKNFLKSFPGPLINNKTKRKELQKYLEDHTNEFFEDDNDLSLMLLSLLKLKLTDNVNFKDIARLLYNSDELLLYLSQPAMPLKQGSNGNKLDSTSQMRICAYLQTGGQEEALQLALQMKDFSMALLIGSLMGKEKWSEVVKSYLAAEIEMAAGDSMFLTNLLSLVFQVFVGSSATAFQEFYINEEKGRWASENWRMVVSAVLNNVTSGFRPSSSGTLDAPPVVVEFLVEYGVFLHHKQMKVPASILFMIANVPLSSKRVLPDVDVKFEFIGSPYSLEGMLFSEIYEFCISDSKAFPILLPQKLYHAACLHERGLNAAASKYIDYLNSILKSLPKKEPFSINLSNQLNNLNASIAGTSTGWLGKPKLSSVWGHLDKSFNKFIGGDDDSLIKKSSGKKVFDGFTPMSSRNNSTLDLSQTPFVPYNGHSKKSSFAQSDVSAPASIAGHSPIRNSGSIDEAHTIKNQPDSYVRRPSHIGNNYQCSPKVSHYTPSRPNIVPPQLRRVHTMQPLSGVLSQRPGFSSEALINSPSSHEEILRPNEDVQDTYDRVFSEGEELSMKKQHYSSTPNLLRRASGVSETSSVRKVSLSASKRPIDTPLLHEELKEASVESDLYSGASAKGPVRNMANAGQRSFSDKPPLGAPPILHSDGVSPTSTVATKSPATEDEACNSDTENTLLRTDRSSWKMPPPKNGPSVTSSPIAMTEMTSGETIKKTEGKGRTSIELLPSASVLAESGTSRSTNPDEGLGIRLEASKSNHTAEGPPPVIRAKAYATGIPPRKVSYNKKSYLPKGIVQGPSSRTGVLDASNADSNGLRMYVDDSDASKQMQDKPVSSASSAREDFSTPPIGQGSGANAISNRISRFTPAEEPEEISAETFEPVIKKTPKVSAFSPAVVQPPETQYDDVVEDESDDEDEEEVKRKKEMEERKAEEEEKRRQERVAKAKKEKDLEERRSGGWFSWLKKDPNEKKPIKAKLGNKKRAFYYDEKLKRWVNNNSTEEEEKKLSMPPPPPPIVKRVDNGPKTKPRSGSLNSVPKSTAGAVAPKNPITGEALISSALSSTSSHSSTSQKLSPPSFSPNNSGVNLSGRKSNGLDDLLNITGGTVSSTRRKKKPNRGYVNVMETN